MSIYAADISGVRGRLFRLEVAADPSGGGVGLLGSCRRIIAQGILERARHAVQSVDSDIVLGEGMRTIVDVNPPEEKLSSSGCDLPIAVVLLQAHFQHRVSILDKDIELKEKEFEKVAGTGNRSTEKRIRELKESLKELYRQRKSAFLNAQKFVAPKGDFLLIGKLTLDGSLEAPDRGVFTMVNEAKPGMHIIVPPSCQIEAGMIAKSKGDKVRATTANSLLEAWETVVGSRKGTSCRFSTKSIKGKVLVETDLDFRHIEGCSRGKKALEVALAGGHPLLFQGPGGQGKTMLAEAAIRLLPRLTPDEVREVNRVYSARGELGTNELVLKPPYQAAGQSITHAGLFGGGPDARPGLVSLAHRGVLFLDEINLIKAQLIEELRGPMNDGFVSIQRARTNEKLPAKFLLLAAMNPCKCGWKGHYDCTTCGKTFISATGKCPAVKGHRVKKKCVCRASEIEKYSHFLSGPIKDRIDLMTVVSTHDTFTADPQEYSSEFVKRRIKKARDIQQHRYKKLKRRAHHGGLILLNGDVPDLSAFSDVVNVSSAAKNHFDKLQSAFRIDSKRKQTRLWLIAQTVSDLAKRRSITVRDINWAFAVAGYGDEALTI